MKQVFVTAAMALLVWACFPLQHSTGVDDNYLKSFSVGGKDFVWLDVTGVQPGEYPYLLIMDDARRVQMDEMSVDDVPMLLELLDFNAPTIVLTPGTTPPDDGPDDPGDGDGDDDPPPDRPITSAAEAIAVVKKMFGEDTKLYERQAGAIGWALEKMVDEQHDDFASYLQAVLDNIVPIVQGTPSPNDPAVTIWLPLITWLREQVSVEQFRGRIEDVVEAL